MRPDIRTAPGRGHSTSQLETPGHPPVRDLETSRPGAASGTVKPQPIVTPEVRYPLPLSRGRLKPHDPAVRPIPAGTANLLTGTLADRDIG